MFGFSSGGFGAWNMASRNPEVFGAMAVLSANSFLGLTHKFMLYKFLDSIWPEAPGNEIMPIAHNMPLARTRVRLAGGLQEEGRNGWLTFCRRNGTR